MHTQREVNWRLWSTPGLSSHPVSKKQHFFVSYLCLALVINSNKPVSTWGWCAGPWEGDSLLCALCCPAWAGTEPRACAGPLGPENTINTQNQQKAKRGMWRNNNFINTICSKCEIIENQVTGQLLQLSQELPWWRKGWKGGPGWGSLLWMGGREGGKGQGFPWADFPSDVPTASISPARVTCDVTVTSLTNEIQKMWKAGITKVQICWLFWSKA